IGTFDPLPNTRNEKLVSLNVDRIKYWLSVGAEPTRPVGMLLGLVGYLRLQYYNHLPLNWTSSVPYLRVWLSEMSISERK
ncbi:hypothetical protein QZH41_011178, partial [Actinostola sp. cb2023]